MEIQTIDEAIDDSGVKICVYGPAGCGKTRLCATAKTPTIILSAESGLLSLKNLSPELKKHVGVIQIKTLTDLGEAFSFFNIQKQCEWIALDSLSEIAETVLSQKKDEYKDPRQAYGDTAEEMMKLIRSFRDIEGYNVIMTCKQNRVEDQFTGITNYGPMMPGRQLTPQIPYMFDEIFALRVEADADGNRQRIIQTDNDPSYHCKDRSGNLEMYEHADLAYLAAKITGETPNTQIPTAEPLVHEIEKTNEENQPAAIEAA